MTSRFGIRGTSPIHCTLYRESTAVYDVTTSSRPTSTPVTSIIRDGTSIAGIEWSRIGRWRSKVTIEGQTGILDNIVPRAGAFTQSREYHSTNGKVLKWKIDGAGTLCVAPDGNTQLAHYSGVPMTRFIESRDASILEIFDEGQDIQDAIVVTWVIMETMARGRNPVSTPRIKNSERPARKSSSGKGSSRKSDRGAGGGVDGGSSVYYGGDGGCGGGDGGGGGGGGD